MTSDQIIQMLDIVSICINESLHKLYNESSIERQREGR